MEDDLVKRLRAIISYRELPHKQTVFREFAMAADEIERLRKALTEISELYSGGHDWRAKDIARRALCEDQQEQQT